jgi:hypothetical protein
VDRAVRADGINRRIDRTGDRRLADLDVRDEDQVTTVLWRKSVDTAIGLTGGAASGAVYVAVEIVLGVIVPNV